MDHHQLARRRIVIDGSNIATEGRTQPSLAQLDEAIRSFLEEYRGFTSDDVTVVVDATFGHRIDPSEVEAFDQAVEHGEMVTPPAGAVGRGDGFILRIAEKSDALVLSNDSFQEFHAERPWLFEAGRLIGGKPVPGVGWVFTPRTPVRGARSRAVTGRSKRDAKEVPAESGTALDAGPVDGAIADGAPPAARTRKRATAGGSAKKAPATKEAAGEKAPRAKKAAGTVKAAKSVAKVKAAGTAKAPAKAPAKASGGRKTAEGPEPAKKATAKKAATKKSPAKKSAKKAATSDGGSGSVPSGGGSPKSAGSALNDPMTFLTFVAEHPVGSELDGSVVAYTSHGAHVDVGGMICHVPLRSLGSPPPSKARQVLTKGETRRFVLVALEAATRRAELALPGLAS